MPEKLAQMKELFLLRRRRTSAPIGGGLWVPVLHPELRIAPPYTEWTFSGDIIRMPEFCAPALGNKPNVVTIEAEIPANANGVLYKLGESAAASPVRGGRHPLLRIQPVHHQRTKIRAKQKLPVGKVKIEVETVYAEPKPGGPLKVT